MAGPRHFAAVIGAAGIVVGPFVATTAAHADDSVAVDPAGYAYQNDRVTTNGQGNAFGLEDGRGEDRAEDLAPVTGPRGAAALGLLIVSGTDVVVPFDVLPDEVLAVLPQRGTIDVAAYHRALEAIAPYALVEDEAIFGAESALSDGVEVLVSLPSGGELEWTVVAEAAEEPTEGDVVEGAQPEAKGAELSVVAEVSENAAPEAAPSVSVSTVAQEGGSEQEELVVSEVRTEGFLGVDAGGSIDVALAAPSGWGSASPRISDAAFEAAAVETVAVEAVAVETLAQPGEEARAGVEVSEDLEEASEGLMLPVTGGVAREDAAAAGADAGMLPAGTPAGIALVAAGMMGAGIGYVKLRNGKRKE